MLSGDQREPIGNPPASVLAIPVDTKNEGAGNYRILTFAVEPSLIAVKFYLRMSDTNR